MPRKPTVRSNHHFYHVTARSNNKENFFLEINEVWRIMIHKLKMLQKEHKIKIGAFVLMNNHFHLLLLTPDEDIDRVMYFLMKDLTLTIQKKTGRINKIFGGRYKGCIIEHHNYLMNVYKYIYRNPVAAGLTKRAEEYVFSTLHPGNSLVLEPIVRKYELDWMNESFKINEADSIKFGLTRTIFQYSKDRATNKFIKPDDTAFTEKCDGTHKDGTHKEA